MRFLLTYVEVDHCYHENDTKQNQRRCACLSVEAVGNNFINITDHCVQTACLAYGAHSITENTDDTRIFLETAELRVKRRMDLTLQVWIEAVDKMLSSNLFEVLHGQGVVSYEKAVEVSFERYAEFDAVRKEEEARLADEADLEELKRIEDEAKKRQGD